MEYVVGLAGNPNTGKSTIFNGLTGLRQHTGNWAGKTVTNAKGYYEVNGVTFTIFDLPGTYSLYANSEDEEAARGFILNEVSDATVVVLDGTCLERSIILALQIMRYKENVVLCVNLMDEAEKKQIFVDTDKLSEILGVPVIASSARDGTGLAELREAVLKVCEKKLQSKKLDVCESSEPIEEQIIQIVQRAQIVASQVLCVESNNVNRTDRMIDSIVTSKKFGIPIMICTFCLIFWLTIVGSNYPSMFLQYFFGIVEARLLEIFMILNISDFFTGMLVEGMFRTLGWVVAVMLPPMAIFFPLFTILEDSGFLPRIAFNLDNFFSKANANGKQSLTMCMVDNMLWLC